MTAATALAGRFDRALLYAAHVHGRHVRKETRIPYVAHLLAVCATVLEYDGSEDVAIAALLHDAAEDQGVELRLSDIRNRFGERVAEIVRSCSDSLVNVSVGQQKEGWHIRKKRYIEHLGSFDADTLPVSLSDKIHNARSILRDLRKPEVGEGPSGSDSINPRGRCSGTTASIANAFRIHRPGQLADELSEIVDALERL